jgi:hypothetical protein
MEPLLVHPSPPPPELARLLDLGGYPWKAVADEREAVTATPDDGWGGAIVGFAEDGDTAWALCRAIRKGDVTVEPLLLLLGGNRLDDLELRDELYDDFCLDPVPPTRARSPPQAPLLAFGLGFGAGAGRVRRVGVEPGDLPGRGRRRRPIDLTYMEYELLKFLAQHPGKVFTRETLLSRVWGYEYYGGARTVDVHIRRLRAKLGEEHANLISTVRSVGYRFGQSRWGN